MPSGVGSGILRCVWRGPGRHLSECRPRDVFRRRFASTHGLAARNGWRYAAATEVVHWRPPLVRFPLRNSPPDGSWQPAVRHCGASLRGGAVRWGSGLRPPLRKAWALSRAAMGPRWQGAQRLGWRPTAAWRARAERVTRRRGCRFEMWCSAMPARVGVASPASRQVWRPQHSQHDGGACHRDVFAASRVPITASSS